ncbi:MAG TPA: hypothetical protein VIN67_07605, partial [Desulfobaccales bacterium]
MSKFSKFFLALILTAALSLGAILPAGAFDVTPYHLKFGDPRWQTTINNMMDAEAGAVNGLASQVSNLIAQFTGWAPMENQDILIPGCTYASATSFTKPGDVTAQFVLNAKVRFDLGAGVIKGSYVASSSYAGGSTTVNIHDSLLTNPLSGVWVTATRTGLWPNGPGYVVAADYGTNQAALASADAIAYAAGKQLVIGQSYTLTSNITLASNLKIMPGAPFILGNYNPTINGSLNGTGLYQIFSCT